MLRDRSVVVTVVWVWHRRMVNLIKDVVAICMGYCNSRPSEGEWQFWRCGFRAGHKCPHRYVNYVWDNQGKARYDPVSYHISQPFERTQVVTYREARDKVRYMKKTRRNNASS